MKKTPCYLIILLLISYGIWAQDSDISNVTYTSHNYDMSTKNNLNSLKFKAQEVDFKIAPNPSKGPITISGNSVKHLKNVKIYNILGSLVKTVLLDGNRATVKIKLSLNKGIYLVKLNTKNGETTTQKLIIE